MTNRVAAFVYWPIAVVLSIGFRVPAVAAAVELTLSPASITAGYTGTITVNVSGVPVGQTVVVDTFLDTNRNGVIDADEPLVQRFSVTDGQLPVIGGVRNTSATGDEDGVVDGHIRSILAYSALSEAMKFSHQYLFQASSPSGTFAAARATFTATQMTSTARVAGQVLSGGSPVPFAYVFLIHPSVDGPMGGVVADGDGNFMIAAAPDTYQLAALRRGFLFTDPPSVTLQTGATATQNLSMVAADRTISGRFTDAATGQGLGGVQIFSANNSENSFEAGGQVTLVFSDTDGNFVIPVTAGEQWGIEGARQAAALQGYLVPESGQHVDTRGGSVTDVAVRWPKATALIYGTVQDDQGHPVGGLEVGADDDIYDTVAFTDTTGNFSLACGPGRWRVWLDETALSNLGYVGQETWVDLSSGQAAQRDLVVRRVSAHLRGRATDDTGAPLSAVRVSACSDQGTCANAITDADGYFDVGVIGGTWYVGLSREELALQGFVAPRRPVTIAEEETLSGVYLEARRATASIVGTVRASTGPPIAGVRMYTYQSIDGLGYESTATTNSNGSCDLGVFDGTWQVWVECSDLQALGYACANAQQVSVAGVNQTVEFVARSLTCAGDCKGDGSVTIEELVTMVNIALGSASADDCVAGDMDASHTISIEEIVAAVSNSLSGCGIV